ncbi:MAG: hypothetical protein KDA80_06095 [Planctomycetaceae bacterium]|nr:hypothetical protein [Planctomycetaceae bacterium]
MEVLSVYRLDANHTKVFERPLGVVVCMSNVVGKADGFEKRMWHSEESRRHPMECSDSAELSVKRSIHITKPTSP